MTSLSGAVHRRFHHLLDDRRICMAGRRDLCAHGDRGRGGHGSHLPLQRPQGHPQQSRPVGVLPVLPRAPDDPASDRGDQVRVSSLIEKHQTGRPDRAAPFFAMP